ncbi:hypothetical protein AQUCO_01100543v1 [Aquilegia coerulea]|uniref:Cyclin-dependent protein kinase inhibitor SMR6 n=1 Tax=Aquilegia coerulea TaxID=218851 RepID=A0A2G5E7I8_AQUCA|nr:hypothetical protein AQUCO_01100543v1 [Aquilegia coerulea]
MGVPQKVQNDGGLVETEGKKWVVAGISLRTPLKPISTNKIERGSNSSSEEDELISTTPTAEEMKIPEKLPCPPPPRKRRPSLKCNLNGAREFFNPPDLETVFTFRV